MMEEPAWISFGLQLLRDGTPIKFAVPQPLIALPAEPLDMSSAGVRIVDRLTFRRQIGRQSPARELADFLRPYVGTWLSAHERLFVVSYQLAAHIVGDGVKCYAQREISREAFGGGRREAELYVAEQLLRAVCEQIVERVMTGQAGPTNAAS